MTDSTQPQLRTLLDQANFARSLAGRWASDGHQADDLVQDALIIALGQGESAECQSPGWWGRLVKNLGRTRRRGEARRIQREHRYARPEYVVSAQEHGVATADRAHIIAAVDELPGPYRDAIRLRYLEGHSARTAAQILGCRESTLATRSAEALRRLRLALDNEREPGRNSWLAGVCIPLRTLREASWPLSPTHLLLMGNTLKLAATVGLMAGLFYVVNESLDETPPNLVHSEVPATQPPSEDPYPEASFVASRSQERVAEQKEEQALFHEAGFHHPAHTNLLGEPLTVEGRVVDLTGQLVAGIEVHASDYDAPRNRTPETRKDQPHAVTDARGDFQLAVRPPATLRVQDSRYASVYGVNIFAREEEGPAVLVVAPRVEFGGIVVNELGEGIPDATVTHLVPRRLYDVPGDDLARSTLLRRSATSDSQGRFRFDQMPDLRTSEFHIQAQGYEEGNLKSPPGGDANVRIVLARASAGPEMITGTVRHKSGAPAPGAWVSAGTLSVQTDVEGQFALDLTPGGHQHPEKIEEHLEVHAVLSGYLPAKVTAPSVKESQEEGERKPLVLVLGGPCLSIHGRVVDGAGAPIRGVKVRVIEAEHFGFIQDAQSGWAMRQTLEEIMGGGSTVSDSEGRFRLGGLLDRDYRVEVLQSRSLLSETSDPVAAGERDVELVLDLAVLETVAGTVVDRHGSPIEGVIISVSRKWPGSLEIGARTVTGPDGTFRIDQATPDPVYLRIEGTPVVTNLFYELSEDAALQELEVLAARRCEIQFEFGDWSERAETVMALDTHGEQVEMMYEQGNTIGVRPTVQIGQGYSDVFAISDRASHIVVLRGEEELARYPVVLTPGEIFVLRL